MGEKTPVVKSSELIKALECAGFREVSRSSGSHVKLRKAGRIVIVPDHGSRDVPIGTLRSILKQAGFTVDEFRSLV